MQYEIIIISKELEIKMVILVNMVHQEYLQLWESDQINVSKKQTKQKRLLFGPPIKIDIT